MMQDDKLTLLALELIRRNGGSIYKTKLFKLLYYCDFISQAKRDRPISGTAYKAWDDGPVPTVLWRALRHEPDAAPGLAVAEVDGGELISANPLQPSSSSLDADELSIVDMVWSKYGHLSGGALIDQTHREAPWLATYKAGAGQSPHISYSLAYLEFEDSYDEADDGPPAPRDEVEKLEAILSRCGAKVL